VVDFDPTQGHEQAGRRPALVLSVAAPPSAPTPSPSPTPAATSTRRPGARDDDHLDERRVASNLVRRLERLGYQVQIVPREASASA
jgi:mRNA-degrading endonuclease toxin of MazEF toxin-antitoxin module